MILLSSTLAYLRGGTPDGSVGPSYIGDVRDGPHRPFHNFAGDVMFCQPKPRAAGGAAAVNLGQQDAGGRSASPLTCPYSLTEKEHSPTAGSGCRPPSGLQEGTRESRGPSRLRQWTAISGP